MAVSFVNLGNGTNGTALSPGSNLPTGIVVGNLLVCHWCWRAGATVSSGPAGWTQARAPEVSGTTITQVVYLRIADGTETAPSLTLSGSSAYLNEISQYSGASQDITSVLDGNNGNNTASAGSLAVTGFNTTQNGDMLLFFSAANTTSTWTQPTSWNERYDLNAGTGQTTRSISMDDLPQSSAGATGNITATPSATSAIVATLLAIAPPPQQILTQTLQPISFY